jgi:TPR repeat protein
MGTQMDTLLKQLAKLALALTLLGSLNTYGSDPIKLDLSKSKQLSQEQTKAYDLQLFNQLLVRSEPPLDKRYRLLQSMAENGHELSYLALKLYDIKNSDLKRNEPEALQRVVELVESGDAAAKCFYAEYFLPYDPSPELKKKLVQYVEEAADGGVPRCMAIHSASSELAYGDKIYWDRQAAVKGDLRAQARMALNYFYGSGGMPKDINHAVCWLREAEKSGTYEFGSSLRLSIDPTRSANPNPEWCKSLVAKQ